MSQLKKLKNISKTILFSFLYLILKEFRDNFFISMATLIIEYLQLHFYFFNDPI
jgi:hypothetical protein